MIICGYQGCGKTTYCKTHNNAVDLDSSMFIKNEGWEIRYVETAIKISETGQNVFISAHQAVINYLISQNIFFKLLVPALNAKAWKNRLEFRYNANPTQGNLNALTDFNNNFEKDMEFYYRLNYPNFTMHAVSAKIVTNIADFIQLWIISKKKQLKTIPHGI